MNSSKNAPKEHIEKREKGFCVHFNNANADLPFNIRRADSSSKRSKNSNALKRWGSENQPENLPKNEQIIEKPQNADVKVKRERKRWDVPRTEPVKEQERSDPDIVEIEEKEKSKSPLKERQEPARDSFSASNESITKEKVEGKENSEDIAKDYETNEEVRNVTKSFKNLDIKSLRQKMKEEKLKKMAQEPEMASNSPKLLKNMEEKLKKAIQEPENSTNSPKLAKNSGEKLNKVIKPSEFAKDSPKSSQRTNKSTEEKLNKVIKTSEFAKDSPKSSQKTDKEGSKKSGLSSEYSSVSPKSLQKSEDKEEKSEEKNEKSLSNDIEEEIKEEIVEEIDENPVELEKEITKSSNKVNPSYPVTKTIPRRVVRPLTANANAGYSSNSRPVDQVYMGIPSKEKKQKENVIQISKHDLKPPKNNFMKPLQKLKKVEDKVVEAGGNLMQRIKSLDVEAKQILETLLDKIETGSLDKDDLLYLEP